MTNREFTKDPLFISSVELARAAGHEVQATKRQASKFRLKTGIAYSYHKQVPREYDILYYSIKPAEKEDKDDN